MSTFQLRHYIDRLRAEGFTVRDDHGEDPDLIDINGKGHVAMIAKLLGVELPEPESAEG